MFDCYRVHLDLLRPIRRQRQMCLRASANPVEHLDACVRGHIEAAEGVHRRTIATAVFLARGHHQGHGTLTGAQAAIGRDGEAPDIRAAVFRDVEEILLGRQSDAVGRGDAAGDGAGALEGLGRDWPGLARACARLCDVNPTRCRHAAAVGSAVYTPLHPPPYLSLYHAFVLVTLLHITLNTIDVSCCMG